MTVNNTKATSSFDGLSTDTKPIDCSINSTFTETDTGDKYEFYGTTVLWVRTHSHGVALVSASDHLTTFTKEYTAVSGIISAQVVVSPGTGRHLAIYGYTIITDSSSGVVNLDFLTSVAPVCRIYPSKNTQQFGHELHLEGAVNESLTLSATGLGQTDKVFLIVNYADHEG